MRVTPWIAANFSIEQALWTCNPATFENPYRFITLFVLQPYYLHNPIPPYKKVREVLEQAGATSNPADAKEVWLGFCKSSAADVKAKVKESTDMQQTLQEIALAELNARLSKTQKSGK